MHVGVALFGGLGPLIFTSLSKEFHTVTAPFYYLLCGVLITAIAVSKMIKVSHADKATEVLVQN